MEHPRHVLITGGTRGIGAAMARHFHQKGHRVLAIYAANDAAAKAFEEKEGIPVLKWNVADPETYPEATEKVLSLLGEPDVLINNAGITRDALCLKMTHQMWHEVIQTNLSSVFYLCQWALPFMVAKNWGRVINLSSVNALQGQKGQVNYAASKAGLLGLTKSLALEMAKHQITVNALAPGYTETDMVRAVPEEVLKKIQEKIPLRRLGKPEEIAAMAGFLASEEGGYITGATLHINGGGWMA